MLIEEEFFHVPICGMPIEERSFRLTACPRRLKKTSSGPDSPLARLRKAHSARGMGCGERSFRFHLRDQRGAENEIETCRVRLEWAESVLCPHHLSLLCQSWQNRRWTPTRFTLRSDIRRRRLLELLSQRRSCTAAEVGSGGRLKRDSTSKQLQELVKAGLKTMAADEADARRQRYTLHPGLTAAKNSVDQWEMDLGCCVMRWG